MNTNSEYVVKLCIMGDGGVGKTTFIERLSTGQFNPSTKMTIGIDFSSIHHTVLAKSGEQVPVDITCWDLGGQDRFRFMLSSYMAGADGGFILYDVERFKTTKNLSEWVNMFREVAKPDAMLYLIGAKSDLIEEEKRTRIENNLKFLAQDLGIDEFFLISSKTDEKVNHLLSKISKVMTNFKFQYLDIMSSQAIGKAI